MLRCRRKNGFSLTGCKSDPCALHSLKQHSVSTHEFTRVIESPVYLANCRSDQHRLRAQRLIRRGDAVERPHQVGLKSQARKEIKSDAAARELATCKFPDDHILVAKYLSKLRDEILVCQHKLL